MHEASYCIAVIYGISDSCVRKVKPVLHKAHAKYGLNIFRRSLAFLGWIIRVGELYPMMPWNQFIHGIKEFLPFGLFSAVGIFNVTNVVS